MIQRCLQIIQHWRRSNIGPYQYTLLMPLTDTRMSELWLARRNDGRKVIVKIALVDAKRITRKLQAMTAQQISEATLTQLIRINQQAIRNEVDLWLTLQCSDYAGIIQLHSVVETAQQRLSSYCEKSNLPGEPNFFGAEYLPGGNLLEQMTRKTLLGHFNAFLLHLCYWFTILPSAKNMLSRWGVRSHHLYQLVPLSVEQALEILGSLAERLAYIHDKGVVHLDLKPQNVMLRTLVQPREWIAGANLVLIDFGIAGRIGETMTSSVSKHWAEPARLHRTPHGTLAIHPGMDVYALLKLFRFCLTGEFPTNATGDTPIAQTIPPVAVEQVHFVTPLATTEATRVVQQINQLIIQNLQADPRKRLSAPTLVQAANQLQRSIVGETARTQSWYRRLLYAPKVGIAALVIICLLGISMLRETRIALNAGQDNSSGRALYPGASRDAFTSTIGTAVALPLPVTGEARATWMPKTKGVAVTPSTPSTALAGELPQPSITNEPTEDPGPPLQRPYAVAVEPVVELVTGNCNPRNAVDTWQHEILIRWRTDFQRAPNQWFDLVAWREGEAWENVDGLVNSETQIVAQAGTFEFRVQTVDMSRLLQRDVEYQWAVILVQRSPYERLQMTSLKGCWFRVR